MSVHVCAGTYVCVCVHAWVYAGLWKTAKSLEYFFPAIIHFGVFGQGLSLTGNSPPRLGCLVKKPQEYDSFHLTSARITGMRFYAQLCWVSSIGQLQVLTLTR